MWEGGWLSHRRRPAVVNSRICLSTALALRGWGWGLDVKNLVDAN